MKIKSRTVQFIWWYTWIGLGYSSWEGTTLYRDKILDYSILLGFLEIRVWFKDNK